MMGLLTICKEKEGLQVESKVSRIRKSQKQQIKLTVTPADGCTWQFSVNASDSEFKLS